MIVSKFALEMKFLRAVARLLAWKMALVSASVESAATDVCILDDHEVTDPFRRPTLACMDRQSGRMLPNAEST